MAELHLNPFVIVVCAVFIVEELEIYMIKRRIQKLEKGSLVLPRRAK